VPVEREVEGLVIEGEHPVGGDRLVAQGDARQCQRSSIRRDLDACGGAGPIGLPEATDRHVGTGPPEVVVQRRSVVALPLWVDPQLGDLRRRRGLHPGVVVRRRHHVTGEVGLEAQRGQEEAVLAPAGTADIELAVVVLDELGGVGVDRPDLVLVVE